MGIRKYMNKIIQKGNSEDMEELGDIFNEMYEHLKECDPKEADEIKMEMYEMACGKILTEDMAKEWVESMKPYGEHWTIEETNDVKRENRIDSSPVDFYVVMNMLYNDFYGVIEEDEDFVKLSVKWLKDEDAKENKLYEYWKHIVGE